MTRTNWKTLGRLGSVQSNPGDPCRTYFDVGTRHRLRGTGAEGDWGSSFAARTSYGVSPSFSPYSLRSGWTEGVVDGVDGSTNVASATMTTALSWCASTSPTPAVGPAAPCCSHEGSRQGGEGRDQ